MKGHISSQFLLGYATGLLFCLTIVFIDTIGLWAKPAVQQGFSWPAFVLAIIFGSTAVCCFWKEWKS